MLFLHLSSDVIELTSSPIPLPLLIPSLSTMRGSLTILFLNIVMCAQLKMVYSEVVLETEIHLGLHVYQFQSLLLVLCRSSLSLVTVRQYSLWPNCYELL